MNQIWKRDETKKVLKKCGLTFESEVALCQTGLTNSEGIPIGKRLKFFSTSPCFAHLLSRQFGSCNCSAHAEFGTIIWNKTGFYNKELAKAIPAAARASRKDPC